MNKAKAWLLIIAGIGFLMLVIESGTTSSGLFWSPISLLSSSVLGGATILFAHALHRLPIAGRNATDVIFHRSHAYFLLQFVTACLIANGIAFAFFEIDPSHKFIRKGATGETFQVLCLLLFPFLVFCACHYLRKLCLIEKAIVLNELGINDKLLKLKSIAWTDIIKADIIGYAPNQIIDLTMRHPECYSRPWIRRLRELLRLKPQSTSFCINTAGIVGNPLFLLEEIRKRIEPIPGLKTWE